MDINYRIRGGVPLRGDVTISGSKNAALPLIAGSILCAGETVLHNVPHLRDIRTLLDILEFLGAETSFQEGTVRIRTHKLTSKPIPSEYVSKLRGSIVLLGPLLARFGELGRRRDGDRHQVVEACLTELVGGGRPYSRQVAKVLTCGHGHCPTQGGCLRHPEQRGLLVAPGGR